jgi:membrane protein implicated in regulation of membrane protease activity
MWMVLGLLCLGLEVANTGSFIFVFFGVAGMAVGGLTAVELTPEFWQQSLAFVVLASASLALFRRRLLGLTLFRRGPDDLDTMVGEIAVASEAIAPDATGKVELRGTTWTGRNVGAASLAVGTRCRVTAVEGLTVAIVAHTSPVREGLT